MSGLPVSSISGSAIAHMYTHMHTNTFLLRKDFNFVAKLKKACQEAVGKTADSLLQLFLDSVQNSPSLPFTLDTFSLWSQIFLLLFFKQLADFRLCTSIASLGFQDSKSSDSIFMSVLNKHGI